MKDQSKKWGYDLWLMSCYKIEENLYAIGKKEIHFVPLELG